MKKFMLAMAFALLFPGAGLAAEYGVYLAPKLGYGFVDMDNMKHTTRADFCSSGCFSTNDDGNDRVVSGGLALGYDFNVQHDLPLRLEVEYMFHGGAEDSFGFYDRSLDSGVKIKNKYNAQTLFANLYYDFYTGTVFTPYLGGGIGLAFIDNKGSVNIETWSDSLSLGGKSSTNFAWNIGAGFGLSLAEGLTLDLGYRYIGLGDAETSVRDFDNSGHILMKNKTRDLYMHQVLLGARMTF